ncbi:MAG: hypothetical protein AAGN46_02250 [Acidobacteriota bacterium]
MTVSSPPSKPPLVVDRRERTLMLSLRGADRVRFLNGQTTNDIEALAAGEASPGFFVSIKGRVEAEVVVLAEEDALRLVLPAAVAASIGERLARYVLAERVEIVANDVGGGPIELIGRSADAFLSRLVGADRPEGPAEASTLETRPDGAPWRHWHTTVADRPVQVLRRPDRGGPSLTLWGEKVDQLLAALEAAGARRGDEEDLDRLRVERGAALWGRDFGPEHFPQETGRDDAVSYTKGCYLGQEVVARIHYRGGVRRRLRGLQLEGQAAEGRSVLDPTGKEVGRLGTVVRSADHGWIALAVLHDRVGPDDSVSVAMDADEVTARVVELPFVAPD